WLRFVGLDWFVYWNCLHWVHPLSRDYYLHNSGVYPCSSPAKLGSKTDNREDNNGERVEGDQKHMIAEEKSKEEIVVKKNRLLLALLALGVFFGGLVVLAAEEAAVDILRRVEEKQAAETSVSQMGMFIYPDAGA